MKIRTLIISLSSCLILQSCGLAPGGQRGGHGSIGVHAGGGNPAAVIAIGIGVLIGTIVATLPKNHNSVGPERYVADGIFYQKSSQGYEVIAAPIGVWLDELPTQHRVVHYQSHDYFESKGTWYHLSPDTNEYQVVAAPNDVNPKQ
ncbi:DUF6515 family protein [Paraglaciecola sp.]|uniref:DUF6515 family protein n=1 Tax=Paraglaciecola sp. TaxID=1920173 RepID=UPI0030F491D9